MSWKMYLKFSFWKNVQANSNIRLHILEKWRTLLIDLYAAYLKRKSGNSGISSWCTAPMFYNPSLNSFSLKLPTIPRATSSNMLSTPNFILSLINSALSLCRYPLFFDKVFFWCKTNLLLPDYSMLTSLYQMTTEQNHVERRKVEWSEWVYIT